MNMLFASLAALVVQGVTVQITVLAASNGQLEVNVIPTTNGTSSSLNLIPKSFVGSPTEFDEGFAEVISGYANINLTLKQQLDDVRSVAEAALKRQPSTKPGTSKSKMMAPKQASNSTLLNEDDDKSTEVDEAEATGAGAPASGRSEPMPFSL